MADRVGVINGGRLILVDETAALMRKLGKRRLTFVLQQPLQAIPAELWVWPLALEEQGHRLTYSFAANAEDNGIAALLRRMSELGIGFKDLETSTSSLEDIFVSLLEPAA